MKTQQHKIILHRDEAHNVWMAQPIGGFAAKHVLPALGVDRTATQFSLKTSAEDVAAYFRSYQPGVLVEVA